MRAIRSSLSQAVLTALCGIGITGIAQTPPSSPTLNFRPGLMTLVAGSPAGAASPSSSSYTGLATGAAFNQIQHVAADSYGNIYIADYRANVVRKIDTSGSMSTIAGTGTAGYSGDGGSAISATFNGPYCIAVSSTGVIYVCDLSNRAIRSIDGTGVVHTVAGGNGTGTSGDGGAATQAKLNSVHNAWVDANNNLYLADTGNNVVRVVYAGGTIPGITSPSVGSIYKLAGTYGVTCSSPAATNNPCGDGEAASSSTLTSPDSIAVDKNGNIFITDGTYRVRVIYSSGSIPGISSPIAGNIYTVAGTGVNCSPATGTCGDGGAATSALVGAPVGITVDGGNNIYFSDKGLARIRKIAQTGIIESIVGTGSGICTASTDSYGDGCTSLVAKTSGPNGVWFTSGGDLLFVDSAGSSNNGSIVRRLLADRSSLSFLSQTVGTQSAAQVVEVTNSGAQTLNFSGIAVPSEFSQVSSGSTDCSANTALASGAACAIAIVSSPTSVGQFSGNVQVTTNAANSASGVNQIAVSGASGKATEVAHLSVTPNPANANTYITFTGNVSFASGATVPSGTVTFKDGTTTIGTATLDGTAVGTYSAGSLGLSTGTHSITAVYSGDSNYYGATSNTVLLSVTTAAIPPVVSFSQSGAEETVFSHATSACESLDIPDDSAKAFRDSSGIVHLVASHYINRASTGSGLDTVTRDCHVIYQAGASSDPSDFNDLGWLESFYTLDGTNINAIVSMDYHPDRHNLPCGTSSATADDCWYSTLTNASSSDGGENFSAPTTGAGRFLAGAPYQFDSSHTTTVGALVPTNIVSAGTYYYAMISVASDQAQLGGECVIRTTDPSNPTLWRAWDGSGFNVSFADPYPTAPSDPGSHVCTPVGNGTLYSPVRTLLKLSSGSGYIAIMLNPSQKDVNGAKQSSVVASSSTDLINWSSPVSVLDLPVYGNQSCATAPNQFAYYYPALLDPNSATLDFETIGSAGYIYATKDQYCGGLNRDLVRYPVNITEHTAGSTQTVTTSTATMSATSFTNSNQPTVSVHVSCNSSCGNADFRIDGNEWGTVALDASGNYSTSSMPALAVGSHTLQILYLGSSSFSQSTSNPVSFTVVAPGSTVPTVIASLGATTFTAANEPAASVQVSCNYACGKVTYTIDGTVWGTVPLGSNGTYSTSSFPSLATGSHTFQVAYLGDSTYAAGMSNVVNFTLVAPGSIIPTVTASLGNTSFTTGDEPPASVSVSCNAACGSVTYKIDGIVWGTVPLNNYGTYSTSSFPALATGTHTLQVFYLGNPTYAAVASNVIDFSVVPPGDTVPTVVASLAVSTFSLANAPLATVQVGCNTACGNVTYKIDGTVWGTVGLNASGSYGTSSFPAISPGIHTLQVFYLGNPTYAAAASNVVSFTITN